MAGFNFCFPIRVIFNKIAREYNPVNLGQGFPDFSAPEYVRKALAQAATGDNHDVLNQYTREFVSKILVSYFSVSCKKLKY